MVSASQIMGYFFQIAGMLVMFYGFVMLIFGMQQVLGGVTGMVGQSAGVGAAAVQKAPACSAEDAQEGVCDDLSTSDGIQTALNRKIFEFVKWLAAGFVLLFIGLGIRAGGEIGGFLAKLKSGDKQKERVLVGMRWRDVR